MDKYKLSERIKKLLIECVDVISINYDEDDGSLEVKMLKNKSTATFVVNIKEI